MSRTCSSLLLIIVFFSSGSSAQNSSLAWKRWQHLQHGVSLSGWFSESGNYSIPQLRAFSTPADLDHIHQLGFDHVRIPVDPVIFQCDGEWDSCERIRFLDEVIKKALADDLFVILDFHPNPGYTHNLVISELASAKYLRLWGQIAGHYAKIDPDRIILEVMNEFSVNDVNTWLGLLQQSIEVIRQHAPTSTIIVQGAGFSNIWDLIEVPPLADPNLIYNFHYYEPHIFTHQGATWGSDYWLEVHDLPFPPTENSVADAIEHTSSQDARWQLQQYEEDHWSSDRIARDIAFIAQWGRDRGVPIMCDEFGVYRNYSMPEDRERWLTALRTALEKNHVGWTAWDYQGGFGVVYKEGASVRDDDVALRGLGLKK
jgi:endoglucanase